jgi:hypothetical protein
MTTKHKVLKDFQLLTEDKKIIIIKAKTIVENYKFKNKNDIVSVPVDVIRNNPEYFAIFDWKEELQSFLRTNKIPQPAIITKKIVPFIESLMDDNSVTIKEVIVEKEVVKEVIIEKPTIVEKQVVVEKPKVVEVEKEVIVEKLVSDDSLSIELENRLNKIKLKENQLTQELNQVNQKELTLENLEKNLVQKEKDFIEKENSLNVIEKNLSDKQNDLDRRESYITQKENNLSDYISRQLLGEKIAALKNQGFAMDMYYDLLK